MNLAQLNRAGLRLGILAPRCGAFAGRMSSLNAGDGDYDRLLHQIQRLRGQTYLADGAIASQALEADGRLASPVDEESFQLFLRNKEQGIIATIRARMLGAGAALDMLKVSEFISRLRNGERELFRAAVERYLAQARERGWGIGEVGGWAVDGSARHSLAALILPLAVWALYQSLGEWHVLATATVRHHSADLLVRLGGYHLLADGRPLPGIFDPVFGCQMELLGFDCQSVAIMHRNLVAEIRGFLTNSNKRLSLQPDLNVYEQSQ